MAGAGAARGGMVKTQVSSSYPTAHRQSNKSNKTRGEGKREKVVQKR